MTEINLLDETIECLLLNGKTIEDVICVIGYDEKLRKKAKMTWSGFAKEANKKEYDNGYGAEEISLQLKIIGPDWWICRREYDGSEWWEFNTMPEHESIQYGEPQIFTCWRS